MMELKAGINKLATTRKKEGEHVFVGLAITLELQQPGADDWAWVGEAIDSGQLLYVGEIIGHATGLKISKSKEDSKTLLVVEAAPRGTQVGKMYQTAADGLLVTISEAQGRLPMDGQASISPYSQPHAESGPGRQVSSVTITAEDIPMIEQAAAHLREANGNMRSVNPETGEIETSEATHNWNMAPNGEPDWLQQGKPVRIKAPGDFHGLTGSVVDYWTADTIQIRGDDGVLFGSYFEEQDLEAVE